MTVSIITATYNSAAVVATSIQSVINQTHTAIEQVFIDGASTDDTVSIIKDYSPLATIVSEKDNGIYDAMNKGVNLATGDIIGILNSDDFYVSPQVIEKVVACFEATGADAVYGDLLYSSLKTGKIVRTWKAGKYRKQAFLYGWMPPHPTFFVRKEVYERYGNFNVNLYTAADYELMLRFLYRYNIKVAYLPEILVNMRMGGASNSSIRNRLLANKGDRLAWEINSLTPYWITLYLKPLRKINQFFTR